MPFYLCYSTQIKADYKKYGRMIGTYMDIKEFGEDVLGAGRGATRGENPERNGRRIRDPQLDDEEEIIQLIDHDNVYQTKALEEGVFKQHAAGRSGKSAADRAKGRPQSKASALPATKLKRCWWVDWRTSSALRASPATR